MFSQKEEATDEVRGSREVETESITDWSVVDLRSVDDVDEKRTVERVQWRRTPAQTFAQIFSPPATE